MLDTTHAAFSGRLLIAGFGSIGVLPLRRRHIDTDPGVSLGRRQRSGAGADMTGDGAAIFARSSVAG